MGSGAETPKLMVRGFLCETQNGSPVEVDDKEDLQHALNYEVKFFNYYSLYCNYILLIGYQNMIIISKIDSLFFFPKGIQFLLLFLIFKLC